MQDDFGIIFACDGPDGARIGVGACACLIDLYRNISGLDFVAKGVFVGNEKVVVVAQSGPVLQSECQDPVTRKVRTREHTIAIAQLDVRCARSKDRGVGNEQARKIEDCVLTLEGELFCHVVLHIGGKDDGLVRIGPMNGVGRLQNAAVGGMIGQPQLAIDKLGGSVGHALLACS